METGQRTELNTADALLDLGVRIPILSPNFVKKRGGQWSMTMRRPMAGTLTRIARIYLMTGIKYEDIDKYSMEQDMELMAIHGRAISEMVAHCIVRGAVSGWLFSRLVGWWLRWRVHPAVLKFVWWQMLLWLNLKDFRSITKSASAINMMAPRIAEEGQKKMRS